MNINPVSQCLANTGSFEELRFWLQCVRRYAYQPVYKTNGRLMAIELLTVVTHPDNPAQSIAPDRYFSSVTVRHRLGVLEEQLLLLMSRSTFFLRHDILASVNVDATTLLAMRSHSKLVKLVENMPWVRFELVGHASSPQDTSFNSISELHPLWLDDFGTGMANFSALDVDGARYEHIKVARSLFTMLRKTPEGQHLFTLLLQLMNNYCQGVIVEGVETVEEWRDVQASPACAAQGHFLARPVQFDNLENVLIHLL